MELASVVSIEPRPDFFGYVHGNTVAFAGWVAIGAFGFAFATITGVISGAVYLLNGRNLWPLIVAHGAWDSFGMYGLYR